jgi:hypothetical protein
MAALMIPAKGNQDVDLPGKNGGLLAAGGDNRPMRRATPDRTSSAKACMAGSSQRARKLIYEAG